MSPSIMATVQCCGPCFLLRCQSPADSLALAGRQQRCPSTVPHPRSARMLSPAAPVPATSCRRRRKRAKRVKLCYRQERSSVSLRWAATSSRSGIFEAESMTDAEATGAAENPSWIGFEQRREIRGSSLMSPNCRAKLHARRELSTIVRLAIDRMMRDMNEENGPHRG